MDNPAKPAPPPKGAPQVAGSSLADAIAGSAAKAKQKPEEDPAKKWESMGAELFDALESKDKSAFGKLFASQVRIAVKEALRAN